MFCCKVSSLERAFLVNGKGRSFFYTLNDDRALVLKRLENQDYSMGGRINDE